MELFDRDERRRRFEKLVAKIDARFVEFDANRRELDASIRRLERGDPDLPDEIYELHRDPANWGPGRRGHLRLVPPA